MKKNDPFNVDSINILEQLKSNLQDLHNDTINSKLPARQAGAKCRNDIRDMRQPITDLATDLGSSELEEATQILGKGIDNIKKKEEQNVSQKGPFLDIMKEIIDDIDTLIETAQQQKKCYT